MKNIILVIIILAAAFVAFNYFQSSGGSMPADEQEVARIEDNFDHVNKSFKQAMRAGAIGGTDATSELDSMLSEIERIEKDLKSLEYKVESQEAKDRVEGLKKKIADFKRKNGI